MYPKNKNPVFEFRKEPSGFRTVYLVRKIDCDGNSVFVVAEADDSLKGDARTVARLKKKYGSKL